MTRPRPSRLLLGLLFLGAGVPHFTHTAAYERVMPPFLPAPHELVLLSGAAEILGGAAVLTSRLRRPARWWLVALLVAIFPANVQVALHPGLVPGVPPALLWLRLPLQGVLIAWVLQATREPGD